MKQFILFIFIVIFTCCQLKEYKQKTTADNLAFGQYKPFVPDSAIDNEWVKQLFKSEHLEISNSDSNEFEWIYGKVFYSPDNYIRIAQIAAIHKKTEILVIETTLQYNLDGKLIEKKLGIENETQQIPIRQIYKMNGTKPTYLIMGSMGNFHDKYDSLGKPLAIYNTSNSEVGDVYGLKEIIYGAYVLTLNKDSVSQIDFITNEEFLSYRFRPLIGELEINSLPKESEKCPEPFLRYDSLKKELSYQLNSGCENVCLNDEDCNTCLIGIFKGVFRYQDSAFVLVENIKEYYSPFENKADTIIKKYKIGSYQFKATAIKKYAEVGEGILQILEVNYTVNGQKMEFVNEVDFEFNNKMNLKPVCKIQSDSSLIILLISSTIPNRSGMCGMCPYEEQTFWHLKGSKLEKLFTININIGTSFSSYEYYKNKELITGNFLENDGGYNPIQTYWKNNSTYVFQIEEDSYKRNFYIKFNIYKNTVSVVRGKEFN